MENHLQQAGAPGLTLESAASFLQEEEDEFERLFTELLYASHSRAAAKMADPYREEGEGEPPPPPPPSLYPSLKRRRSSPAACGSGGEREEQPGPSHRVTPLSAYQQSLVDQGVLLSDTEDDQGTYVVVRAAHTPPGDDHNNQVDCEHSDCDHTLSDSGQDLHYQGLQLTDDLPVLRVEESEEEDCLETDSTSDSMEQSSSGFRRRKNKPTAEQLAVFRKSHSFPVFDGDESSSRTGTVRARHSDMPSGATGRGKAGTTTGADTGDKLFFDLLDDLDNLTGNTPSMKRRARARDIFSDWLFSEQLKAASVGSRDGDNKKKNRKSFHEFMSYRENDGDGQSQGNQPDDVVLTDRQSRAGSEPSEGRHAGGGCVGQYDMVPIRRKSEHQALCEKDALLERRLREEYLAAHAAGTGNRCTPEADSHIRSPLPTTATTTSQGVSSPLAVESPRHWSGLTPTKKGHVPHMPSPISPTPSPTPITPPQGLPRRGWGKGRGHTPGFSANHTADTLEILKNVKFRKKSSKYRVMSEAGAKSGKADQELSQRMSALGVGPRGNIYQRWKLIGRPVSFEYLSEKIYSGSTVVYSKRRSLQEESQDSGHTPPPCAQSPEDLFTKLQEEEKLKDQGVPRPPLVPEYAWNTLRQVAPTQTEAETSFNDRCSDEYGSIRFDTVRAFVLEDDADSGYHTGESTLCGGGGAPTTAPPPPGERTLSREDLKRRIEAFNDNQHGLLMTLRETSDTFQGFIRVYMNLMRPISMSLTARPPSIYDILTPDVNDPDEYESDTQLTSFYLPKDTTKVIHITSDTTAQEVIRALLQKFRITDNPRKFALYERLDEGHSKSTMRRLRDDECPLPLCLCWTAEGLNFHRFILQENDTGEIQWEAFSIPELDNFLRILDKEEDEYVDQVKAKYQLMKIQMVQHMKHLDQQRIQSKDQRTPVFV